MAAEQVRFCYKNSVTKGEKKSKSILVVGNNKGSGVLDDWAEIADWGQDAAHTALILRPEADKETWDMLFSRQVAEEKG